MLIFQKKISSTNFTLGGPSMDTIALSLKISIIILYGI